MVVEFKTVEAIDSLVALLRVADASAVHCWEQDEPFHPGVFPGLILLARFASQRAGEEHAKAMAAAAQIRNLEAERNAARELHLVKVRQYNAEVERRLALEKQLAQVTAERDEARQKQLEKHVEWASFYNGLQANLNTVKAELGAARKQVAELTEKLGELPDETAPEPHQWQVGDEIECNGVTRRKVTDRREGWVFLEGVTSPESQPEWERRRWKLYRKASDPPPSPQLPPETAPEPYDWQVGDEIECPDGTRRRVKERDENGWLRLDGLFSAVPQFEWERAGWKLYRKASDMPDLPPFTPQQVAEFAAATKPFDDSVSAAAADEGRP